jgi:glycerol-1-phosphate dehydrogenase [NAD(P)+]
MEGLGADDDPPLSHGFKVGIGSIASEALFERVLDRDLGELDVDAAVAAWPDWPAMERQVRAAHGAPQLVDAALEQSRAKHAEPGALRDRLSRIRDGWPELRERLRGQLLGAGTLRDQLRAAGAPTTPEEIGLGSRALRDTYLRARTIRSRYTILDLAAEAGILEACVDELFAPDGFWGAAAR